MIEMTSGHAEFQPPLKVRIGRKLGFHGAFVHRPEEPSEFPSYMVTYVRIQLGFLDRLRVLVTGRIDVETLTQTDVEVRHTKSTSDVGLPIQ